MAELSEKELRQDGNAVNKKKATRDSYGEALRDLADRYPDLVVLDADVAEATKTAIFRKAYPDRHFDCGIQEANMMGVAAGLAAAGKIPFVSSFAMFAAGRAYEIIRNSVGYPHLNVKIGATHAGISVGEDGATHQCCEDIALMRTVPGMTVIVPSDDIEAKAAVEAAILHKGPVYLRFGRLPVSIFNDSSYKFEIGKGVLLRDGTDITVIACGILVPQAMAAAEELSGKVSVRVINMPTVKPVDEEIILKAARETGEIITLEEHSVIGGLGDAVAAVTSEKCPVRVKKLGVNDVFGHSGPGDVLLKEFDLTKEGIVKLIVNR
ncbi:MAG: transketolase family protein [Oscillospiraceae bacterium]|jgi:transketolase|nr:transketolase family protein [Oscillospiraceae bacterium]